MIKIPHSRKYLEAMTENIRSYYMVTRPIYSENAFSSKHKKVIRYHKTLLDHLKECFRCPTGTVKRTIFNLIPIAAWLPMYNLKEWLLGDMISGISTGMVSVLQGLAFALLVNVSPVYGLYSAFYPTLIYIFLGTSKHISVGPFPVLSLMVGSAVMRLVPDPVDEDGTVNFNVLNNTDELTIAEQRVLVAASVTVLVGIFQLVFGLLHAGFIVIYLSDPLISGFTTAAAIHVLVSQLKFVLGLKILNFNGPLSLFFTLEDIFQKINNTNIADLATSIIIMVVVLIVKELNDRYQMKIPIPVELIMLLESSNAREYVYITTRQLPDASHYISSMRETILATGISYAFDFNRKFHVQIIGELESGYQPPITPSISVFEECMIEAFTIAIVAFAIGFSVARVYSIKHDYPINGNQELVAFGLGNIVCGFFKGFAVSTALSRSAVQESTGGKSQISGLISALIVMIVTLSIGFLLETLPKSVLGAICLINLKGMMMQFREVPVLWMKDKFDCSVWVVTFTAAVILGLDLGLAVGVGFELLTVVFRTQFPKCTLMARVGKSNIYRNRKDYLDIFEPEGMKIFRCPSPIFFANSGFFKDKLNSAVGFNPVRVLHKRNKALRKIRKLLNKGILQFSPKGVLCTSYEYMDSYDDLDNMKVEELNNPINTDDLPFTIDWKSELPHNIEVPKVELHTLILDFGAVSFIDVSGMKNLKTILKDYLTIEVDVYIASIDSTVLDKLNHCGFFDDSIQSVILFPTIHDAVLYALSKRGMDYSNDQKTFKDKGFGNYENGYMNGNIRNRDHSVLHETTF